VLDAPYGNLLQFACHIYIKSVIILSYILLIFIIRLMTFIRCLLTSGSRLLQLQRFPSVPSPGFILNLETIPKASSNFLYHRPAISVGYLCGQLFSFPDVLGNPSCSLFSTRLIYSIHFFRLPFCANLLKPFSIRNAFVERDAELETSRRDIRYL
jgi:hypothetical protein